MDLAHAALELQCKWTCRYACNKYSILHIYLWLTPLVWLRGCSQCGDLLVPGSASVSILGLPCALWGARLVGWVGMHNHFAGICHEYFGP